MTAVTRGAAGSAPNPLGLLLVLLLALALILGILAVGSKAVLALVGLVLFFLFLRNPVYGLYLTTVVLLLSGVTAGLGLVPYGAPSAAAKAVGGATIAAWILNSLTTGKRFRFNREVLLTLAFVGWALVGIGFSLTWRVQLPEWTRLVTVAGYFILAIHLLDSKERLHQYVVLVLLCAFIMSVYAISQYFIPRLQVSGVAGIQSIAGGADLAFIDPEGTATGAAVRVTGGTGHSNWLAFTLLLILPLNVYWYGTMKRPRGRVFVLLVTLVELAALVLTFTRLSLVVGAIVAFVLIVRRAVRLNPYRVAALAAALVIAWFLVPSGYKERVIDFTKYSTSESTSARIELQSYAWEYMQQFPVVGVGLGGFGLRFYEENAPIAAMLRWMHDTLGFNPLYYGPHNMYLQLGSETGTVGLLFMFAFFIVGLMDALRAQRLFRAMGEDQLASLSSVAMVSILSFLFCALFLHGLQQKIWWMVFAVAVACYLCASRMAHERSDAEGAAGPAAEPLSL